MLRPPLLAAVLAAAPLALGGCATTPYTGPVEVTRFLAPGSERAALGQGSIALAFPEEIANANVRSAFAAAVGAELARLGYTVVAEGAAAGQTAAIRTARSPVTATIQDRRGPVNVGVGGSTGSYGSGLGVGINLGGGREGANAVTDLSVRIARADGTTLWEGRAQLATGVKSPYSEVDTSARTLAAGLFRDFPGGNGETVTIDVRKLQGTR